MNPLGLLKTDRFFNKTSLQKKEIRLQMIIIIICVDLVVKFI